MDSILHYLYKNRKTIQYDYKNLKTNVIDMSRDHDNVCIKINNVSITLPKVKLTKILKNKGGSSTYKKNQIKINKKKTSSYIDITIRDENNQFESAIIYSPHFNTADWHQFKCFIEGKVPVMILSLSKPQQQYDKSIETKIGFGIYPLDMDAKSLNEAISLTKEDGFFQTVDKYTYEFALESPHSTNLLARLKEELQDYLNICSQPILVQNLSEIENVLGFKLPQNRLYNFDEFISFDDFESTRSHSISKDLMVYGGNPHQSALTLSKLYFDKEILKNPENKLDKLIENANVIKQMEPVLYFDI